MPDRYHLDNFLTRRVVLDTQGPMLYIGYLASHDRRGYWLTEADVHDRSDGHSSKEQYLSEALDIERSGVRRSNRKLVFVDRLAVVSVSALDDIAPLDAEDEPEPWLPEESEGWR